MKMTAAVLLCSACITSGGLFAQTAPAPASAPAAAPAKIQYVGAISINPCQDAKVLAEWYAKFGFETREFGGGYYGKMDMPAGKFVFGIHPKKRNAPEKCTAGVAVVYRVDNFDATLAALKAKGLVPESTEKDRQGQFAHFFDPDGNKVSIWGD